MAFSFGNTGQPAFGATGPKLPAFGAPFGSTPATTASGFGGFGTSFGTSTAQSTPGFGMAFGAPSSAPAFGATATSLPAFGTATTSAAPAFGTSFGATTGGGLFGATTKPSLFGTPATSSSLFSTPANTNLFGTSAAPSTGLFGSGATGTTPGLFGTNTTSSSLFPSSFGTTATTSASGFGLFGAPATSSAPSLFGGGGLGTTQTGSSFFGGGGPTFGIGGTTAASVAPSMFGGAFGVKPAAAPGVPQLDPVQQQNQLVMTSIYAINIFNDERDDILKKWNMLQACWGTGKGYYNASQPPVEYTVSNPLYRFKAVGYNMIPNHDNAEGIVKLVFNRKYSELSDQKQVLIDGISGILGNRPNLKVNIITIRSLSDTQTEVRLDVMEKGVTGNSRKIMSSDLSAYLNQPAQKQQLANVGVASIIPYVRPSKVALDEYARTVPAGFDPQMWRAAVADNPNADKYVPVPIYGFNDLKARKQKQEYETGLHKAYQEKITNELAELKKKNAASMARINEFKQRFVQLQHRTLKVLVRQESIRKANVAIQPEEEYLKGKLEVMYSQLNLPTQFKGQLNELISTVKLMEHTSTPIKPQYKLVTESQVELKDFLQLQQNGISKLVDIVKEDMRALNIISNGMRQIVETKH